MVEIDGVPDLVPETAGLPVVVEVTADERLTGGALAAASRADVRAALAAYGVDPG